MMEGAAAERNPVCTGKENEFSKSAHGKSAGIAGTSISLPVIPNIHKPNSKQTKAIGQSRELFSHFSLTMDKETAKYMPYDNVAFPKLVDPGQVNKKAAGPEMDTLWMVGFLDHEVRNEKESTLRDIAHFVSLPGGKLLPGAAREIRKIYSRERKKTPDFEKKMKGLTEGQKRRVLGKTTIAPRLSDDLMMRLKELGKTRGGMDKSARELNGEPYKTPSEMRKQILRRRRRRIQRFEKVYKTENDKIRKALRQRRPIMRKAAIRSHAIEDLCELEREQTQAAMKIQKCYKSYKIREYWKSIVVKSKACVVIQRYVRGMITRTLVRVWLIRRSWLVIIVQAVFRGNRSRIRTKAMKYRMVKNIIIIQKTVRGTLARIRMILECRINAATKIQSLWRGCTSRVRSDRMWLNLEVTKIQKVARGFLGRIYFRHWKPEALSAAIIIQKTARGIFSRKILFQELWARETQRQRDFLKVLLAEDHWLCEEIEKQENYISRFKLKEKLKNAQRRYEEMEDVVFEKEWGYLALKRERARVDPEAIRQGWSEELDKYIVENRKWVTNAKFEFLFVDAFRFRQAEENFSRATQKLEELKWRQQKTQEWRNLELRKLQDREAEHRWKQERKARIIRIADQKRKWKPTFYTRDGKIDKRRSIKLAWSNNEHEVFNVGSVDIFALSQHTEAARILGADPRNSLQHAVDKVALINAKSQLLQYGAMFMPLFNGMEKMSDAVARFSLRNQLKMIPDEEDQETHNIL